MTAINFTEDDIFEATIAVFKTMGFNSCDGHFPIVRGQVNNVPEPKNPDYMVLWPLYRIRLSTNMANYLDTTVIASITDSVMNVTMLERGTVAVGTSVYKATDPSFTAYIKEQRDGTPGQVGSYCLSSAPDVRSQRLYVGRGDILQPTEVVIQCDIHGPNSGNNAQILSTLFRDWFSVNAYIQQGFDIAPLYADDPRQMPFMNAEQNFEDRWTIDIHLQANQIITVTQQFADVLTVQSTETDSNAEALRVTQLP